MFIVTVCERLDDECLDASRSVIHGVAIVDVDRWRRVEEVLDVALTRGPAQWSAVLDETCSGDPELRREVEALLERLNTAQGFLESPPAAAAAALLAEARESAVDSAQSLDRRVGAYRLVREIGRGGMSRVYLAERADGQFQQSVALKILRPGLDSDLDLERFRAERQILASLNHPHIARLLDGGVSDDGQPFLVMELVEGEPLDRYAATRSLTTEQRLTLFLTVTDATQFAHRNLVVHRDLKPSNILVTSDGMVKLLDFGLAKLLGPAYPGAAAPTTQTSHRWMTPEYAAPEQIRGEPVTTLTDVYQLGALLYELVSGRLPFGMRSASAYDLEAAALTRDPEPLGGHLRGDVEAIVAKAMRKRPDDRYASAQELADDIRRHLSGHPVTARHQTAGYIARRFVRRHRIGLAAASVIVLLFATYVTTVAVDRARIARALAEAVAGTRKAEQTTDFMMGLFEASEGGKALTDTLTARELLSRGTVQALELSAQPELQAQMLDVIGRLYTQLGDYDRARPLLDSALTIRRRVYGETHADVATSLEDLADVVALKDDAAKVVPLRREALALRRRLGGSTDPKSLSALHELANALHESDQREEATHLFDEWLALVTHQPREVSAIRADQISSAAALLTERGRVPAAESLYREALSLRRAVFGPQHHAVAASLVDLSMLIHDDRRRLSEADTLIRQAVEILRAVYPEGHVLLARALRWQGQMFIRTNRFEDAATALAESRAMYVRLQGPNAIQVPNTEVDLAYALIRAERYPEAERTAREAEGGFRRVFNENNAMVFMARIFLGDALRGERRFNEAEPLLLASYARFEHPNVVTRRWRGDALAALVRLYEAEGKPDQVAKYQALLAAPPVATR